jgi:hypothetical protein
LVLTKITIYKEFVISQLGLVYGEYTPFFIFIVLRIFRTSHIYLYLYSPGYKRRRSLNLIL